MADPPIDRAASAEVIALVALIRPLLAGKDPLVQGAALADLTAIWLAGHHVAGDSAATQTVRAELLARHLEGVAKLVPINAHLIGTTP